MKFLLLDCPLFEGTTGLDFLYNCIRPRIKRCVQGETVPMGGDVGLVLSGRVDFDGRVYRKDDFFGETYSMLSKPAPPYTAPRSCAVMLIPADSFKYVCDKACADHQRMIENFNRLVVERLDYETRRNRLLCVHGIKSRYLAYLRGLYDSQGVNPVKLTMRLGQIAEYLCVSRPSLSREIKSLVEKDVIRIDGDRVYIVKF